MATKDTLKEIIRDQISASVSTFFLDKIMAMVDESADNKASLLAVSEKVGSRIAMFIDVGLSKKVTETLKARIEGSSSPAGIKRQHARVSLITKVKVTFKGESQELYSETLSSGGMYLRKNDPYPKDSELKILLPMDDGTLLDLTGVVVYTNVKAGSGSLSQPGMAVEFRDVKDDDLGKLRFYVEKLCAQGSLLE